MLQCGADGEHYYCECSSNFIGIAQQENKIIRLVLVSLFALKDSDSESSTSELVPCRNKGPWTPDNQRGVSCDRTGTHR